MYGDTKYEWVRSGATTASADTGHSLFGNYGGLSNLNVDDVLHVQLLAGTNGFNLLSSSVVANGMKFNSATSVYYDLPPVSVQTARSFHFSNSTASANSTANWTVWRRI